MANELNSDNGSSGDTASSDAKSFRQKPTKTLPTDRLSFEKQTTILRGIVKASLAADRGAVSNIDASQYADAAASSVSLCNAFFVDCGLTTREGIKMRPVEAVFEYDTAAEWEPDTAGHKLAPVLSSTWFAKAMMTKLALKPSISTSEALAFLAQQCNAPLDYKPQLSVLLEYLNAAGLILLDGATVAKATKRGEVPPPPPPPPPGGGDVRNPPPPPLPPSEHMKRITIALPDKESVVIEVPESFDADDWILVADQLAGYIKRWKKYQSTKLLKDATQDEDSDNDSSKST